MADAIIDRIDPTDLELVTHLYNQLFRPERSEDWIARRLKGRHNILVQVASIDKDAVGFSVGMELKPSVHFSWICGVVPEMRRTGIATQLMRAAEDWARVEGYASMRFECSNQVRGFLHFGIANGYDIVGIRWDPDRLMNLIIFEKLLGERE
ncbi:MAG: GNAT family N-acetyltransferase [Phycisphaerales bacterium]|nr:GNAT family N-acetyltransferase [Phycisphaerales bacterium]